MGQRTGQFVSRHPRALSTAIVVALAGFAATAFGLAPLAPDASDLPQRLVSQDVAPEAIAAQLEALAEHELTLYRGDLTRSSDTADSLLRRLNITDPAAAAFLRSDTVARKLLSGRSGKMVRVRADASGRMLELVARYPSESPELLATHFTRLTVSRVNTAQTGQASQRDVFRAVTQQAALAAEVRLGSGTINNSLFGATDDASIPDPVANQLAEIFDTDIDFHRELRRGDTFSVIYEAMTADGEPIPWNQSSGRVLAAQFVNNGKLHSAVWFKDSATAADGGAYFDLNGQSKRRSFLASPVEFSRVTSGFAMRFHPILKLWRHHNGVDYAAPTGTPVRTVGDGTVTFAGRQSGYGNVVEVDHGSERSTVYAHLSRIDVKKGQHVQQGTEIGEVGATGWATGPHLHFEFKIDEEQQDPMVMAKASGSGSISAAAKPRFSQLAQGLKAQLEAAETMASSGEYAE